MSRYEIEPTCPGYQHASTRSHIRVFCSYLCLRRFPPDAPHPPPASPGTWSECIPFHQRWEAEAECDTRQEGYCIVSETDRTLTPVTRRKLQTVTTSYHLVNTETSCAAAGFLLTGLSDCAAAATYVGRSYGGDFPTTSLTRNYYPNGCFVFVSPNPNANNGKVYYANGGITPCDSAGGAGGNAGCLCKSVTVVPTEANDTVNFYACLISGAQQRF